MSERTLSDRIRDWTWDFNDIYNAAADTVVFHIQEYGWIAIVVIAVVVIVMLLLTDATGYITELVLASAIRSIFSAITLVIFALVSVFSVTAARMAVAKLRRATDVVQDIFRRTDKKI
jgi:hypothetical protein